MGRKKQKTGMWKTERWMRNGENQRIESDMDRKTGKKMAGVKLGRE